MQLILLISDACDADYDNNGVVGFPDFGIFSVAFGSEVNDPQYDPDVDADGDGVNGFSDFGLLSEMYGETPGPGLPGCDGTILPCS